MKKILWFSRHEMTEPQLNSLKTKLGPIEITQVSGNPQSIYTPFVDDTNKTHDSLAKLTEDFDIIAVVLPIHLQQQLLNVVNNKPIIMALNERTFDESGKVAFVFSKWEQLLEVKVLKQDF